MSEARVLVVGSSIDTGPIDQLTEELVRRQHDARPVPLAAGRSMVEAIEHADALGDEPAAAVVFVPGDEERFAGAPLGGTDGWDERCEGLLLDGLHVAQAAHQVLVDGGRLVFVLPDVGITGAAGQVALATAVEGLRALVKSAGRQWADVGITTATILTPTDLDDVDLEAVADVVVGLLGPAGEALDGVTLPVGSGLMVP